MSTTERGEKLGAHVHILSKVAAVRHFSFFYNTDQSKTVFFCQGW